MEKIRFVMEDTGETVEFFVLEQTKLGAETYILVTDSEEDDAECLILREEGTSEASEGIYEIVEDDCKLSHNNILFIDDVKENLEPAKEKGWNICNAFGYELGKIQRSVEEFLKK